MRAIGGSPLRHGPPLGVSNEAWAKYSDAKPSEITRNMQRRLGLDVPWYVQYERYLARLARRIATAQARDYPLTLGLTVVLTTAVVVVNLLSDVALAAVDPRLRERA